MSNVQAEKAKLDQLARLQQMKLNARLTALQAAQSLMQTVGFIGGEGSNPASKMDSITLVAMAKDVEQYILGEIEAETEKALAAQQQALTGPKIVRP